MVTPAAGVSALAMTYLFPNALVRLSPISCEGMAQLLPLVLLALFWRRKPVSAALAVLSAGLVVDVVLVASGNDPFGGVGAGVVGLAATCWSSPCRPGCVRPSRRTAARRCRVGAQPAAAGRDGHVG